MFENANIVTMEQLSGFVPGHNILTQTQGRPNLVIRGLTSDEVSPTAQPRVSVYLNQAPNINYFIIRLICRRYCILFMP